MVQSSCPREIKNRRLRQERHSRLVARDIWIERCDFERMRFEKCDLRSIKDHENRLEECIFKGCTFDGAAFGINTSRFNHCDFEDCSFKKAVFDNAVFADCTFSNCRFSGVDFSASGFWRCRFVGRVEDVVFRGTYQFARDREQHVPVDSGLHMVDFFNAELKWIALSNGCPIVDVVLPKNGDAIIVDRDRMRTKCLAVIRGRFVGKELDAAEAAVGLYANNDTQARYFVTSAELAETYGNDLGPQIFEILREHAVAE